MISLARLISNVLGITCLLAGTTVAARIPRLTRLLRWRIIAVLLFVIFVTMYVLLVDAPTRCWLGFHPGVAGATLQEALIPTAVTIFIAFGLVLFSSLSWYLRHLPDWLAPLLRGARPLTVPGSIIVVCLILYRVFLGRNSDDNIWPLVLSSAIFLYLWWLTVRLFDLIFAWHRYTRHAVFQRYLSQMRREQTKTEAEDRTEASVTTESADLHAHS